MNKTNIFITTSTLALLALILFQISWYRNTVGILNEQFDSTVNMAMSLAIQNIGNDSLVNGLGPTLGNTSTNNIFTGIIDDQMDLDELDEALGKALRFYNIDLEYEFLILDQNQLDQCGAGGYCCVLSPFVKTESQSLQVFFPNRTPYLRSKMKFQLGVCLLIILFITAVFVFANFLLRHQRRIAQSNIDFFNNMAHEFNTPLTNIGLATKLISKSNDLSKSGRFIKVIDNESIKLKQQVERFLQLTQMENGGLQLQLAEVNLKELVQGVISDMQLQIIENGGTVQLQSDEGDIYVQADKFHLSNAFRNLIDNAIKYAHDAPEISIFIKKNKESVNVLFEDKGIGIAAAEQKQIFKKFHRVHTGDIHQQKGFGLGLAYVKMIVEAHKGAIEVFSELKKGSRFNLRFPLKSTS